MASRTLTVVIEADDEITLETAYSNILREVIKEEFTMRRFGHTVNVTFE